MSYSLHILSGGFQHPPLELPSKDAAVAAVRKAHIDGFLMYREPDRTGGEDAVAETYIVTGPSTIYRSVDTEVAKQKALETQARNARMSQGLIAAPPAAANDAGDFVVIVMLPQGEVEPPLGFETFEQAAAFVKDCEPGGLLEYDDGQEYTAVQPGSGMTFLVLSRASAESRRRMRIEQMMRLAQQQRAVQEGKGADKKLILPGN